MLNYESQYKLPVNLAGVDEAGRGPLAGPVIASAVILRRPDFLEGLNDSKKVSQPLRKMLFDQICDNALSWGIAIVGVETISKINILQSALLAMRQAVEKLTVTPSFLLIDGNHKIDSPLKQRTLIKGDSLSRNIAAASILAKVTRDRIMLDYHHQYPQYRFDRHKGYGTVLHRDLIRQHGPCPIHRKTFRGVKEYL